ncbi:MAG: hypothetical protein V5A49_07385 [Haloarcula sp.]
MYVETDFLLALIKDEDWLGEAAESVYRDHRDELWTSQFTLIELLMVAIVRSATPSGSSRTPPRWWKLRGDVDTVVAAATYVEDHGFTPFDALHLVESDGDTIVSSDETYESVAPRLDLKTADEE